MVGAIARRRAKDFEDLDTKVKGVETLPYKLPTLDECTPKYIKASLLPPTKKTTPHDHKSFQMKAN